MKNGFLGQAAIESSRSGSATAGSLKAQAAMEYLMTYGWALLVIVIVIAILLVINPFSAPQTCKFDSIGFGCERLALDTNGKLYAQVTNGNPNAVIIGKIHCTSDRSATTPTDGRWNTDTIPGWMPKTIARQGMLDIGEFSGVKEIRCVDAAGAALRPSSGTEFSGRLWLQYKNAEDPASYPNRTVSAVFSTKVS